MELFDRFFRKKTTPEGQTGDSLSKFEVIQRYYVVDEQGKVNDGNQYYEVRRNRYGDTLDREHIYFVTKKGHPDAQPGEPYATKVDQYPDEQPKITDETQRRQWVLSLIRVAPHLLSSESELKEKPDNP